MLIRLGFFFQISNSGITTPPLPRPLILRERLNSFTFQGSKVLTQKADPLMAQIVPRIDRRREVLILSFSGLKDIEVDLVLSEDRRKNRIAEDICIGNKFKQTLCINLRNPMQ